MKIKFEIPYTPKGMRLLAQLLEELSSEEDCVAKTEKLQPIVAKKSKCVAKTEKSQQITTFAQLVTALTENAISEQSLQEALKSVGLEIFPALGARPELIPIVAGKLGL